MKGLYVIIDPEHCKGRDPLLIAEQALLGGCALLQLRDKLHADGARLSLARKLRAMCKNAGVPFWFNDRADLALLCEADGLHLGQDDLPLAEARTLMGRVALGLSTHNQTQVLAAVREAPALIGFGPVFATASKQNPDPVVGLDGLREACRIAGSLEVVAIGGIQLAHAAQLRDSGAKYAAVIGAVCGADDPRAAAYALHKALVG